MISPEGCASILWRDPSKSLEAARAMKLTSNELFKMQSIDEIIEEPIGGAHRNKEEIVISIKKALNRNLDEFKNFSRDEIYEQSKNKFLNIGKQKTITIFSSETPWVRKSDFFFKIKNFFSSYKKYILIVLVLIVTLLFLFK